MATDEITRTTMIDALAGLRREDVRAAEFLVLRELMGWILSDENPGGDYIRPHAALLGGMLFAGLDDASEASLEHVPDETPTIVAARGRLVAGAHELANYAENRLAMLGWSARRPWPG